MKNFKRLLTIAMVISMMCGVVACGSKTEGETHIYGEENGLELGTVETEIDPASVFANLEIVPELFYGIYYIDGDLEQYKEDMEYMDVDFKGEEKIMTKIPYEICMGPENVGYEFANVEEYDMAKLVFVNGNGEKNQTVYAAYEVNEDSIKFNFVDYYDYNSDEKHLKFRMSGFSIEYGYEFNDSFSTITLTTGENQVDLSRSNYSKVKGNELLKDIGISNYLADDSKQLDNIKKITISASNSEDYCWVETSESDNYYKAIVEIDDKGLLTMTYEDKLHKVHTHQFAYIYCASNGIILADNENVFYYTKKEKKYSDLNSDCVVEEIK